MKTSEPMRILVVGGYGLIGAAVCRHLIARDYEVTGLGRNATTAERVLPHIDWIIHDLRALQSAQDWTPLLSEVDVVVNCAGTLQTGASENTEQVHHRAIAALAEACNRTETKIIQISAVGAQEDAATAFMRTKALGDRAVQTAQIDHWILRPGLVLAPHAYGGTALIRMLAATPYVQPIALKESHIQTVAVSDVCKAIELCLDGTIPAGSKVDLVEAEPHSLTDIIAAHRIWLGFKPAKITWTAPDWLVSIIAKGADSLGHLGWRSALRSTAVRTLRDGVIGDETGWVEIGQQPLMSLKETLNAMPATAEHRQAARLSLLFPLVIATLALFWFASGLIGLLQLDQAASVLIETGWSTGMAKASVVFWSLVDIGLAAMLMVRRWAAKACWFMIAVSLFYLMASTITVPGLWLDPLGPLIKVIPSIILALVARVLLENR